MPFVQTRENMIKKYNQDIADLNAKRSSLRNEAQKAFDDNKKKIDREWAIHQERIVKDN